MKQFALAIILTATFSPAAFAAMDCDKSLENAMHKLASMSTSGTKRASLARMVATGYDYCVAGDEFSADKFFKMAEGRGN